MRQTEIENEFLKIWDEIRKINNRIDIIFPNTDPHETDKPIDKFVYSTEPVKVIIDSSKTIENPKIERSDSEIVEHEHPVEMEEKEILNIMNVKKKKVEKNG